MRSELAGGALLRGIPALLLVAALVPARPGALPAQETSPPAAERPAEAGAPATGAAEAATLDVSGIPGIRSRHFTTGDGVRLHYLEVGPGEVDAAEEPAGSGEAARPALVLVPGWTMPAAIWEKQLAHFAPDRRVVALDPRSQGESEKATEGHYPERRAEDIADLLAHLGGGPFVLVGWSLGVPEVLTYVDRFGTDRLAGVVLVDGFIGQDPDPDAPNPLRGMLRALHEDRRGFADAFVRDMYRRPQSEAYLARVVEASLRTPTNTAFTLLGHLLVIDADWRPALGKVDRPLLYVATPQLASQAEMVGERRPDARVEVFEEAGHALFVDEAARFNTLLEEFLAGMD